MNRREMARAAAGAAAFALARAERMSGEALDGPPPGYSVANMDGLRHWTPQKPEHIVMLLYPGMTALDLVGPQQAFGYVMGAKVELAWKDREPVTTDTGIKMTPSVTFEEVGEGPEVLFVPGGGKGTIALMNDKAVLAFLREKGRKARYVTSVCSGSLVLGAAGLLRGYRATSHWAVRDVLGTLGATVMAGRVVEDRNRITAGGITAGLDFGLRLAAKLRGDDYGQALELMLEYDPHPPFHTGTPEIARVDIREAMTRMYAPLKKAAQAAAEKARSEWGEA